MFFSRVDIPALKKKLKPSRYIYSNVLRYAYINTRIGAMKSYLLKTEDVMALEGTKNLRDFIALLEHTQYKKVLSDIKDADVLTIDRALVRHLIGLNNMLIKLAPKSIRPLLLARFKKHEMNNIKTILSSKVKDIPAEKIRNRLVPVNEGLMVTLLNAQTVEELVNLLVDEGYSAMEQCFETYKETDDSQPLMAAIDKAYFEKLWDEMKNLSRSDEKIARKLIGIEIDAINIMSILRGKWKKYYVKDFIIPIGHGIDPVSCLERCAELETIEDVVNVLSESIYALVLEKGFNFFEEKKSLLQFEIGLRRYIMDKNETVMRGNPFHIGTVLGFLKLKEAEIENLRALCICISEELPKEEISQLLV